MNPRCAPHLEVCRYHQRKRAFASITLRQPEQMVVFVESGSLGCVFNGIETVMHPGTAVWIPPGSSRSFRCITDAPSARHYNLRFSLTRDGSECIFTHEPLVVLKSAWGLHGTLQQLHDLSHHSCRFSEERLRALLVLLFSAFFTSERHGDSHGRELSASQRIRLDTFVVKNIASELSPAALATHMHLSLEYFSRLFRTTYGMAPRRYLKYERMRLAAHVLLESALSVKEVAAECGMTNMSLFCRQFRAVHGCTPSEYRERATGRL
jgi:AraC-like DNA-binding protein